jgi:WXG100 family type VII secretion target
MSKIGAELEQMQQLRSTFDRNAQSVNQLNSSISGQVSNTWWVGPAADKFRAAWEGEFRPALKKLEQALMEAGQEVQRRHDALQQAGS